MYAVGGFDFPTVTGDFSVDLDFEPVGVIMVGGNQATVGSLVTGLSGPCCWLSLNGTGLGASGFPASPSGTTSMCFAIQSNTATGGGYVAARAAEIPISVPAEGTNPATIDYRADTIALTSTGFTLHVATAAPSR